MRTSQIKFRRIKRAFLTVSEAAEVADVSVSKIYRLIRDGILPAYRRGRSKRAAYGILIREFNKVFKPKKPPPVGRPALRIFHPNEP